MTGDRPDSADWLGTVRQFVDLWLALQVTVGVALAVGIDAVIDYSTRVTFLALVAVPVLLAVGLFAADRAPDTRPLWAVGLALVTAALGVSLLSSALGLSVPESGQYLLGIAAVVGTYGAHRTLRYVAESTAPE